MDWSQLTGKRVLVTGGAGMIGCVVVRRLVERGCDVVVADNLWRGSRENLVEDGAEVIDLGRSFVECDLRDAGAARRAVEGCWGVVHLADIVAGIGYVFGNEFSIHAHNTVVDQAVLAASIEAGVERYVYAGSACSYPAALQQRADPPAMVEGDAYPAAPESAYGWSKLMGEYIVELAEREGLIAGGIVRLHNVYGPRTDLSEARAQVIPSLIRKAVRHPEEAFVVWGSGRQRRAFLYVDDAAEAIVRSLVLGMGAGPVQVGHEFSTSIAEIAERVCAISGKGIEPVFDRSKPEGDFDRYPDISKCRDVLGFAPRVGLDEGLARTYAWAAARLGSGLGSGSAGGARTA